MKVIIVEVTRAANSFGRTHLGKIREAYELIGEIVAKAQAAGELRSDVPRTSPRWPSTARSSRCSPGGSSADPAEPRRVRAAKAQIVETICDGLDAHRTSAAMTTTTWSSAWCGPACWPESGALASIVTTRVAAVAFRRIFGEDPPE